MARVRVSTDVQGSRSDVWTVLRDLEDHARWMADVAAIRITSARRAGAGTRFDCVTKLGPIGMTIPMAIVAWEPERRMATRYDGTLRGGGELSLRRRRGGQTRVTWRARIRFPWWLGGPFGAFAAARILKLVWRRSLANLRGIVEERDAVTPGGWRPGRGSRLRLRARSAR